MDLRASGDVRQDRRWQHRANDWIQHDAEQLGVMDLPGYPAGQHTREHESWYINQDAVDSEFFTVRAMEAVALRSIKVRCSVRPAGKAIDRYYSQSQVR